MVNRTPILQDSPKIDQAPVTEKYTRRQWVTLLVLLLATLTSSLAVCLFPPFFPRIAEEKGFTATVYGVIIGTNCLASFIVTPFIGNHLSKIGMRFGMIIGMFIGGSCCALSGLLEFFQPGWEFVALAIVLRIVHATGNALVITATFSYAAIEFENDVGKIFSFTRAAMNVAQLIGPCLGGALYEFGRFCVPFIVMGSLQIIMSIMSIPILPECSPMSSPVRRRREKRKSMSMWSILLVPKIWISFLTFIVATTCNGFLSINLEPKVLRHFGLSQFIVGLLFGLKDGANSVASPVWGFLCDKSQKTTVKPYIIISALLVAASFFLLGASSVIGITLEPSIPLVVVALCLNGVGIGGEQVAGVMDALHEAVDAGFSDDPNLHGMVAGLWSSLSGLGRFASRSVSGLLVDRIGFNETALVATSLQLFVACITLGYMVIYVVEEMRVKAAVKSSCLTPIMDEE